jgi:hypothetical protein
MSYINLNINELIREMSSLIENNYGNGDDKKYFIRNFKNAKKDILNTISEIIDNNILEIRKETNLNEEVITYE